MHENFLHKTRSRSFESAVAAAALPAQSKALTPMAVAPAGV